MTRLGAIVALVALGLLADAGCGGEEPRASGITAPSTTTTPSAEGEANTGVASDPSQGQAAAAGPEDDEPAARRPTTIEDTLDAVLTGSLGPRLICDRLVTARYVRTAYGAREGCIAAQKPGALARSIELVEGEEVGEMARAVVIPSNGPYDGVEVEVALVRERGGWRVDSLLADVPAGP